MLTDQHAAFVLGEQVPERVLHAGKTGVGRGAALDLDGPFLVAGAD